LQALHRVSFPPFSPYQLRSLIAVIAVSKMVNGKHFDTTVRFSCCPDAGPGRSFIVQRSIVATDCHTYKPIVIASGKPELV
jgi:hypothetical protein